MSQLIIRKYPTSKNKNPYREVFCKDCGDARLRRSDAIKRWNGRCRKCASIERERSPELKARRAEFIRRYMSSLTPEQKSGYAERARRQVLRQGGIPNAKRFVREGQNGRRMAGELHYAWKGGVTSQAREGRSSREYAAWRIVVFQRDDFTCRFCGVRGGKLHADHILPWSTYPQLRFRISNGRTLCIPCHKTTPSYGWKGLLRLDAIPLSQAVMEEGNAGSDSAGYLANDCIVCGVGRDCYCAARV